MSGANDIIANIKNSQDAEKGLIDNLDNLSKQAGFNIASAGVRNLIDSIQSLSDSRMGMFNALSTQASTMQAGVANSRIDLISQMTLLNVVEEQLDQAKQSISTLQGKNDTKKRMVEVNTYYGKRYEAQSRLMKIIIIICAPLLILFILKKKGLIPPMISNYLIGITIAVGAFVVIRTAFDIATRDNIDFDEINLNIGDPSKLSPTVWEYNKMNMFNFDNPIKALVGNLGLCFGESCCSDGLYFDTDKQQCTVAIPRTGANAAGGAGSGGAGAGAGTESFVCGSNLQGTNIVKINATEEQQNGISPFSYSSTFAPIS
jgi:hypothetical protein